ILMNLAGYGPAAKKLGMHCADFDKGRHTPFPQGIRVKNFTICNAALSADGLISIAKVKTHSLTRITAAVKNQFGCVPGSLKGQMHARYPDVFDFSKMLVDLTLCIKPRLYIADGIVAMEGNGPQSGDPFPLNVLLMSADPVALDTVICKLIDLDPGFVPTITAGADASLGINKWESINRVGDNLEDLRQPSFSVVRRPALSRKGGKIVAFIKAVTCERPVIDKRACTRCGTCIKVCPLAPKALAWPTERDNTLPGHKKIPRYDYHACIRCFCCHEFCPHRAISIRQPLAGRFLPLLTYLALLISKSRRKKR
ncbi:MAG: DUF362 domain-containing protein, partial [Chitinivibrionales bacterium]|nr:DUF362 domain-containing protein [Chitinivibrionales bacterium]